MYNYIKLIRIKHWLKNLLIFLPLFFSINIFKFDKLFYCFIGFLVFSLSSSISYIINDINDVDSDQKHEVKKNRPIASKKISINKAVLVIFILIIINVFLITYLYKLSNNFLIVIIPIAYVLLNIVYSISLKHKPIIDVVILVFGFILRIIYGGVIVNIEVSNWLYLMVIFGSFYLGFGKRRNEIIKSGKDSRKVLKFYSKEFLDKNMYIALTLAIAFYSLWCTDPVTISRAGTNLLFWTIPLVMVIFQLYSLNIEGDSQGDPIEVILSDKKLIITIFLYILIMILLLYFV